MDLEEEICKALIDIEEDASPFDAGPALIKGLVKPPSYIVLLLMCQMLCFPRYRYKDKSAWKINIRYRGRKLRISAWERGCWSIDAPEDSPIDRQAAMHLKLKIQKAWRILDEALVPELQRCVDEENFSVHNAYGEIRTLYLHFRSQVERMLSQEEKIFEARVRSTSPKGVLSLNTRFEMINTRNILERNMYATIAFFFSYTDSLFEILFAFKSPRTMTFRQFLTLSWGNRFSKVFPVDTDDRIAEINKELLDIKRHYRDALLHGSMRRASLLVPLETLWAVIPVDFDPRKRRIRVSWPPFPEVSARQVLDVFLTFDRWIENDQHMQYVLLYAESGLPIPFQQERVDKIRGWMSSREAFEEVLENERANYDLYKDSPWRKLDGNF